ncbi:PAS domain S-box protein [Aquabacterium sp.]|uniref:PAS domain S-box protein n=1 Tax=Aquabacterium sp. TaxID=1872578 RepID=UPI002627201C|nr:PAS domain S-box protein [Aquabacterium sp.]MDD2977963.1 PAS domain S-box protein [Aquabacterium sp.]
MITIAHRPHEEHRSPPAPVAQPLTPDAGLSALAALACTLCQTPMALISRVTPQYQQLVAQVGLGLDLGLGESGAALPHLAWTIATLGHPGLLVVSDVSAAPTWQDDWLASGPAGIRFYAGLALHGPDGQPIGTLCVMDTQPRELDAATQAQFSALGQVLGPALAPSLPEERPSGAAESELACYRTLVESQTDLISLATPQGRLTFVNPAFAAHAGRPAEALIGTSLYEHLPAADREAVASQVAAVCAHALVLGSEVRHPTDEGAARWTSWTHHPLCDAQGRVWAVQSVGRDITERKLTERSLKDSQTRLRSLYESTPAMLHSIDAQGRLLTVSDTWLAKMGYTRSEVIGRNSADFLTPESHDYARNVVLPRYLRDGRCDLIEYQMVRKDGTLIDVLLSATMERDAQGHPLRSLAILEDVTEKHAVEAALRANQERLSLATQANGIGIWELDLVTQRLTWSEMMFQIFGLSRDQFQGRAEDWQRCVHPDDLALCVQQMARAVATGQPMNFDFRIVHGDGSVHDVNASATVFYDKDGGPLRMLGTNYDVTERKRMDRELAEKHELLRVTLHSIGDAVITTDARGRVQWLNPVAERMTGWRNVEACGQALSDVFRIVDEATGQPEMCPVSRSLCEDLIDNPARLTQLISRDGTLYGIEDSAAPIRDAQGQVLGVVLVFHDVTEQRRMGHEMSFRATHDELTGLVNRSEFETRLLRALHDSQQRDSAHALMYIDLDQFKLVNDACGHAVGDQLLRQVTELLNGCVRSRDTLARLGGDEFGVILEHCDVEQAERVAQKICDQMEEFRFVHDGRRFRIGTSIGLVPLDKRWSHGDAIMQAADTSCYAAKEAGRNRVHVWFDTDLTMHTRKGEMQWATRLEQALDEDRFLLYGQRIVPIRPTGEGLRCEVLIRLQDHDGSIIPPGAFLPAAERFQLASRIDRWVVRQVFALLASGDPALDAVHTLAVNLSGQSISDPAFQRYLLELIDSQPVDLGKLCFEITETAAITKLAEAGSFIQGMRRLGMRLALDDFGSGSSSFGYLKALQVDYLKIDGQFIKDVVHDPLDRAAVRCFCDVARVMGLKTVGEFVEDDPILQELLELGVDYAQGYLIHRPEPLGRLLGLTE